MSATSLSPGMPSSAASPARRAWMAVLARTPRADLEATLAQVLQELPQPVYDWLRPPEIGLAMVRGRVGGSGDPFNLGEATVTRATLRLRADGAAPAIVGVACHLGRDRRRAELAALADALLQMPEHHDAMQRRLIGPLAAQQQARRARRQQDADSTRVEFFTMVRGD
ncbi:MULTISPECIES: phosphonate C-P lyase system protein PhnG [Burkholderiaceae]|uniref:phosphonate C-P lyase system protein PhnG n=1 Tax=Burkholderiaceae TaxID=119060 RepID=UPI00142162AE|nr:MULTISPECIES: phosphonate C-P lyase system protein PhnG [Burkholderiaceae]NIF52133.1 phosphonate C-P lyase system protein PhnG [Burkholderia sp. Ax-1724]NIF78590.1 phosphonate C-P lyase system protein PhnG [Paraburkholderia sp. Cy-641]